MIKQKIVALAMSAVCAFSAIAFASCSNSAEVIVSPTENEQNISSDANTEKDVTSDTLPTENTQDISSEVGTEEDENSDISNTADYLQAETAVSNCNFGALFEGKVGYIKFCRSYASSFIGGMTAEEEVNTVLDEFKDIALVVGESDKRSDIDVLWVGIDDGNCNILCSVYIATDGTVVVETDKAAYFSAEGAIDYNEFDEFLSSKENSDHISSPLWALFNEDIRYIIFSLSIASSYMGIFSEEEDINAVYDELKDIVLTVGGSNKRMGIDTFGIYICGEINSVGVCVDEDGTVTAEINDVTYVSYIGAADYNALNEYFCSKGA